MKLRTVLRTVAFAVSASLALAGAARADVSLTLRNGRVTLIAKDATIRQILAEWARVGKTKIVNGDRIPGGPMTIELRDVPEADALDVLLRTLSGYLAAPRTTATPADASVFDSIAVMPTVAATAPRTSSPSSSPAPFSPPPVFNQNEEEPQETRPTQPAARPPIFSTFPSPQTGPNGNPASARPVLPIVRPGVVGQPQPQNNPNDVQPQQPIALPQQAPPPATTPGAPAGVSAPGMIAPAPGAAQPGQTRPPGE